MPDAILGHRIGWFPGTGLAFAEGHPVDFLGGGTLAAPVLLPGCLVSLVAGLRSQVGLRLPDGRTLVDAIGDRRPGFAGLRRLDTAVDYGFPRRDAGLAFLEVIGSMELPRCRRSLMHGASGLLETVYWRGYGTARVMARVYDKGAESGEAPRGRLIRMEDQRRFQSGRRPAVDRTTPATVHHLFRERFQPLAKSPDVLVGDVNAIAERLADLAAAGTIRPSTAEKLVGMLHLRHYENLQAPRATRYRRRAKLRELGLHLANLPGTEPVEVQLGRVFDAALGADAWAEIRATANVA